MSVDVRSNQDGSISYCVRYRDATGRDRRKTFRRERDAAAFDAKVTLTKRSGEIAQLDAGRERLEDFAEEWWQNYALHKLERSTLVRYTQVWNKHVLDRLGGYRLRDLTPRVIDGYVSDLERAGVGAPTIRKALAVLQAMLREAVRWERITANPVKSVPKPRATRQRAVRPLAPASVEAIRSVLLEQGERREAALISVLAYGGLRPGEAFALRWRAVGERTLVVDSALSFGTEKSDKARRGPRSIQMLAALKLDLAELRSSTGQPDEDELIFPNFKGQPIGDWDYRNWRKRIFKPAAVAAGLPDAIPYDLRHSFASLLIHEGRSVVDVARQMGHAPEMTWRTYAHVIDDLDATERVTADELVTRARGQYVSFECPSEDEAELL